MSRDPTKDELQHVIQKLVLLGCDRDLIEGLEETNSEKIYHINSRKDYHIAETDPIADLLSLFLYTSFIFDTEDIVREWFRCEIPALSNSRPIDLLATFKGRTLVRNILEKIEHGEFS